MVLGTKMAVILRAKGGNNFLIQTNGLPGKAVHDATADALQTLAKFAASRGTGSPPDGSGDAPPGFALGRVAALQGQYAVTYRMVNAVLILLVSDPGANAFLCLRALDAAAKVLVAACKGVDVTADRVARRYLEVHAALGGLLCGGLAELPAAFVHTSATDEKLLAMPLSAADAARRLRKLVAPGGTKAGSAFVPDKAAEAAEPTPAPVPETPTQRGGKQFDPEGADPLGDLSFDIPADALPPPPPRAAGIKRRSVLPPPRVPSQPPSAFQGAMQDDAQLQPPPEAEGFGAFGEVEVLQAETAEAAAAEEEVAGVGGEVEGAPAPPSEPSFGVVDLRAALQLVEIYRGEVVGEHLKRGGVQGAVRRRLAPYGLQAARFRVRPAKSLAVNACLNVAGMNKACTSRDAKSAEFVAALSGTPMDCSYLTYSLPPVACDPPVQVELVAAPQATPAPGRPRPAGPWQALLVLRFAVNPALAGPLLDVVVDVDLPPEFTTLVRVSPAALWSTGQCRLRWQVGRLAPGDSGMLRAVVAARADVQAARGEEALREAVGRVTFTGQPGRALSGVGFEVAAAGEGEGQYVRGTVLSFGEIVVRA